MLSYIRTAEPHVEIGAYGSSIISLLWQTVSVPYWFDGNNLIGQTVAQARTDRDTRRAFLALLSGYAASRGGRFTVYFDGDDPDRSASPPGVQVRFSAPLSADDAMLRRLDGMRNPAEVIIVTNDSALRSRSMDAGGKSMSWDEFVSLMNRTSSCAQRYDRRKEDPVKIEDWIRYFGFDDDLLE